jgi:hypothetical protein
VLVKSGECFSRCHKTIQLSLNPARADR